MADKDIKEQKTWMPALNWLGKALLTILVCLTILFFLFNFLLKPYMRNIPVELTPWLDKTPQQTETVKPAEN